MAKKMSITLNPANATQGSKVIVEPPGPMGVAEDLLVGIRRLAAADPPPAVPLAMLCAHATECALKAYLQREHDDPQLRLNREIRHNVEELWGRAARDGLGVEPAPPSWAILLSRVHDGPHFDLRYAERFILMQLPPADEMAAGVTDLLEQVRRQL